MKPLAIDLFCDLYCGDALTVLAEMPEHSVDCSVTSPPYWGLRDYGVAGQLGLEATPEEYTAHLVEVFRVVRRVLKDDGTLWLNLGDSYASDMSKGGSGTFNGRNGRGENYARSRRGTDCDPKRGASAPGQPMGRCFGSGLKPKDLVGIPWRVAFALQADGWWLRSDIIWSKPNPMPENVTDRPTKAHEYLFLLAKSETYHCDMAAIAEPVVKGAAGSYFDTGKTAAHQLERSSHAERIEDGKRNRRSVWIVATEPYPEAHFATFPADLIRPCILAGCKPGGVVLDPFAGSGTTLEVARACQCRGVGIELNPAYCEMAVRRLRQTVFDLKPTP